MCVDPATATAVASIGSIAMTAGQGALGYVQGKATDKAMKQAARQELMATATEESALRREQRKFSANQRVAALATGGDVASGSLKAVLDDDVQTMELNALMRRYGGETRAEQLRFKGANAQRTGLIQGAGAFMQAGVEALGAQGRNDFAAFGSKNP